MNPPGQSSIEALHTVTLYIYISEGDEPSWLIDHRGLAYHYTADIYIYIYIYIKKPIVKQISITATCSGSVDIYIYISVNWTPHLCSRDALTTGRPNQFLWTNVHWDPAIRWTPLPIQHRCLDYQYTKSVYMDKYILRYHSQMNPPNCNKSCTFVYSFTFHAALYVLSLYISCHLEWSNWTGQSCIYFYRTFLSIYLWLYDDDDDDVVVVVVYYTTTNICCCCYVLHNNNKDNYKIHRNWLWSLC